MRKRHSPRFSPCPITNIHPASHTFFLFSSCTHAPPPPPTNGNLIAPVLTSGTKSAPREIMLENSILPKDPGFVRVSTPPRVITLSEHHFPSASDEPEENAKDNHQEDNYGPASLESIEDPNSSNAYFSRPSLAHGREPSKRSAFSKYNNELTLTRR